MCSLYSLSVYTKCLVFVRACVCLYLCVCVCFRLRMCSRCVCVVIFFMTSGEIAFANTYRKRTHRARARTQHKNTQTRKHNTIHNSLHAYANARHGAQVQSIDSVYVCVYVYICWPHGIGIRSFACRRWKALHVFYKRALKSAHHDLFTKCQQTKPYPQSTKTHRPDKNATIASTPPPKKKPPRHNITNIYLYRIPCKITKAVHTIFAQ